MSEEVKQRMMSETGTRQSKRIEAVMEFLGRMQSLLLPETGNRQLLKHKPVESI